MLRNFHYLYFVERIFSLSIAPQKSQPVKAKLAVKNIYVLVKEILHIGRSLNQKCK